MYQSEAMTTETEKTATQEYHELVKARMKAEGCNRGDAIAWANQKCPDLRRKMHAER